MRQLLLLLVILFLSKNAVAQNHNMLIGKVTDARGIPLQGATVHLAGTRQTVMSDEMGSYLLKVLPGVYEIICSHLGYGDGVMKVQIVGDQAVEANICLYPNHTQMNEVVITGVKMQTSTVSPTRVQALDVPQSISVVGQRTIRQQAAFDLATIIRNVPGVIFTGNYSGAGTSQFFSARGFDLNESQNYRWNGMMVLNWANHYADNIEQVEFLKGPASILFGDVAPGGVMNFVTKKPLAEFAADLNFKTGSWGLVRPALDITGPITKKGNLRYRLNASSERKDSFRNYVRSASSFAAPAIAWNISRKITINLEAVFKGAKATDDAGLVSPDGTSKGLASLNPSLYLGEASREYQVKDQSYFATLTYELSPSWRVKATAFSGITRNRPFGIWFDQPDLQGDFTRRGYGFYRRALNRTISAEASGTIFTGRVKHSISIGADYQTSTSRHTNGGELDSLDTSNIFAPVQGLDETQAPEESPLLPYSMIIRRKGLHIHDQVGFFDGRMFVYGGIRASSTVQGNRYLQDQIMGSPYEGLPDDIVEKFMLIPRLGLIYKPRLNHSIYISYAQGVEVNSPDIFARNYLEFANPPATVSDQLELGLKSSLISNRLGMTLAVFAINKKRPYGYVYLDSEHPNFDEYTVYYQGHHRSQGMELEMDGKIFAFLTLNGGMAFTSTKVIHDPGYPAGNLLPNAPKFSFNYWINYEHPRYLKGLSVGTGMFYKGKFYPGIDNNPQLLMTPTYSWDASAAYQGKQIGIQLNVMNLTNQISYLNPWQFNLFDVKPLRQVVVTLSYKWRKDSRRH
ncbi:TonB-dependent receptor [Pedobacter sp. GR22-6]|uniref:TonB-dependent receptor n=1 Tax=Pedobacter sp. GR22-6 TaxID=3127957 RepID=UPI00307E4E9E